jgi:hypothetical protein
MLIQLGHVASGLYPDASSSSRVEVWVDSQRLSAISDLLIAFD